MNPQMDVAIGTLRCKNPVWVASGTFLYGQEYGSRRALSELGAICTKGTALEPWPGVQGVRIAEVTSGVLNAIGLQNPGIDHFIDHEAPKLRAQGATVVANLIGKSVEEYAAVAAKVTEESASAIELNISCPNVKEGGVFIGTDRKMMERVVSAVRAATRLPLIIKLVPDAHRIVEFAKAAEDNGADAVSVANCLAGMAIDIRRRRPVLGTRSGAGGLSGAAVKPMILKMVWDVASQLKIPIVAIGGVTSWQDAVEYLMAGATAVEVGSAIFSNPDAPWDVLAGLQAFLKDEGIESVQSLIGAARPVLQA